MDKKPAWLKVNFNREAVEEVQGLMAKLKLNTVCKEANCPNLGECYKKHTATFMILGRQCTRNCRFCNVVHGAPEPVDPEEPENLAEAALRLGLKHVVITSVTRDDLPDGGAAHFAACIRAVRATSPDTAVEVLIPDMKGVASSLDIVIAAKPDVFNHNVETVKELYEKVRPEADYDRSLDVLRYAKSAAPDMYVKTGIMVGLGETEAQVCALMDDVLATGCDILTVGQYLRPSSAHVEMKEYISPETFARYKEIAEKKGFRYVASSPLVRSSYRAEEAFRRAGAAKKD